MYTSLQEPVNMLNGGAPFRGETDHTTTTIHK